MIIYCVARCTDYQWVPHQTGWDWNYPKELEKTMVCAEGRWLPVLLQEREGGWSFCKYVVVLVGLIVNICLGCKTFGCYSIARIYSFQGAGYRQEGSIQVAQGWCQNVLLVYGHRGGDEQVCSNYKV